MNKLFLFFMFLGSTCVAMQPEHELPLFKMPSLTILQQRLQNKGFYKLANHPEIQALADQDLPMAYISASVNYAVFDPDIYFGKRAQQERAVYESLLQENPEELTKILLRAGLGR